MTLHPRSAGRTRATETAQVVLPNDSNPLGYILGGTVMHLIDITGAIACHRHTNALALTAGVDSLDFLHPVKVGDIIILKSRVTCTFRTSLEVEVEVFSEGMTSGERRLTSHAFLTFVSLTSDGEPKEVPPLLLERSRGRGALPPGARAASRAAGAKAEAGSVGERRRPILAPRSQPFVPLRVLRAYAPSCLRGAATVELRSRSRSTS